MTYYGTDKPKLTPEQDAVVRRRYLAGDAMRAIAVDLGCGREAIRGSLRRQHITIRPSGPKPTATYDEAELRYDGDWVRHGLILRPAVRS